jgi:hypothetical protein
MRLPTLKHSIPKEGIALDVLFSHHAKTRMDMTKEGPTYKSLKAFYPFYLSEHRNSVCRTLHFIGTTLVITSFITFLITFRWYYLAFIPLLGYGFAWIGHAFFEKNKPATFRYPMYSLASDFIMFWDLLVGKEKFNPR